MKKTLKALLMGLGLSVLLAGCSDISLNTSEVADANEAVSRAVVPAADKTKTIVIHLYGAASGTWNVWAWRKSPTEANYSSKGWPGGDIKLAKSSKDAGLETVMTVDPNYAMGILFVKSTGSPQTSDIVISKALLEANTDFYFNFDESKVYTNAAECLGLKSASIASKDGDKIKGLVIGYESVTKDMFTVTGSDGTTNLEVASVAQSGTTVTITLTAGNMEKAPYTVTFKPNAETDASVVTAAVEVGLLDEMGYTYDGNDLGLTLSGSTATFKAWSPLVDEANVLLYADAAMAKSTKEENIAQRVKMIKNAETGVWTASGVSYGSNKYYKYEFITGEAATQVADIWANCASPDSYASQIVNINSSAEAKPDAWEATYVNPFGRSGTETKRYSDAVIYEMHVRDWSRAVVENSTGKYLDLANSEKFMKHLKDIGVTHVQILPVFDHAETNASSSYNWGYNPYHYNVPEGRYVTKGYTDGTQAVKEFRTLIQKLHENGISVIMDVVYNHTSGTGINSLYDKTVNKYFYRMTKSGAYSNGSGCGNEFATNHVMARKYVVDSLKHWMNDYHINGFRFDLMGCLETDTMREIYDELYAIDKNVLVYGEPWTGGTSAVVDGAVKACKGAFGYGYGAFDDDFRDAIKGAEFGGFQLGHVAGKFNDDGIIKGLTGAVGKNKRNETGDPQLALHYAECHDNYTLFDKLAMSYLGVNKFSGDLFAEIGEAGLEKVRKEQSLVAAYLFLSQGTPFINGGQEFLRTKKGDENSYKSKDDINQIDLSFKETYSDVYDVYRSLIAFRKDFAVVRNATVKNEATKISTGVTKFVIADENDEFEIFFNATEAKASVSAEGKVVTIGKGSIGMNSGIFGAGVNTLDSATKLYKIAKESSKVISVPAKSFVILKK